ncbi:unnamed protein product [Pseudo-nitzschia multistriata]|uniref:Uncharacterized protein n=1 Tax=Pseudo-nitzschia multistriata TaxID=183589 RepID=A0A448YUC9_9STRA|nr:unnamed protein product [Pseudo-nitzschia multistriata]
MMNDVVVGLLLDEESEADNKKARFHNGNSWVNVVKEKHDPAEATITNKKPVYLVRGSALSSSKDETPVSPVLDGNGKILVAIQSFRDGEQCGDALVELFKNAKDPDNVVVSLVEQQNEDDPYCVEVYCKISAGVEVIERSDSMIYSIDENKENCPRINQIRTVRVQDIYSKGPPWARALGRRSLGNEEFCLQTVANSAFVENWDEKVRKEWISVKNEFGIISNPPQPRDKTGAYEVPRTCTIEFLEEEELPHYNPEPDGKVEFLEEPLLSHTWSPGFSFSKCHLEETAPADGFLPYVSSDIEAFARYARFWTRGYDVYTPTQNIVYLQSGGTSEHSQEWITNHGSRKSIVREKSLKRIRSFLEIQSQDDDDSVMEKPNNLGIYGIGKRRSLSQLNAFVGITLNEQVSRSSEIPCGNFHWVPYNSEISPMNNLYSNPNNLDPQPEYPLRTNQTFQGTFEQSGQNLDANDKEPFAPSIRKDSDDLPYGTVFIFWVIGLVVWCSVFGIMAPKRPKRRKKKRQNTIKNK